MAKAKGAATDLTPSNDAAAARPISGPTGSTRRLISSTPSSLGTTANDAPLTYCSIADSDGSSEMSRSSPCCCNSAKATLVSICTSGQPSRRSRFVS